MLLVPALFAWGILAINKKVFPYDLMIEVSAWIKGPEEGTDITITQKLQEDILGQTIRETSDTAIVNKLELPMQQVSDPKGLLIASESTLKFYARPGIKYSGYYVFFTFLDMPDAKLGVVILNTRGVIENVIPVTQTKNKSRLGHGGITDYGDILFPDGLKLHIYDYCGNYHFTSDRLFHHKASGDKTGFWSWENVPIENNKWDFNVRAVYVGYDSQQVEKSFTILDVLAANPDAAVLESKLINKRIKDIGLWKYEDLRNGRVSDIKQIAHKDPFHANDIDILTEHQSQYFPQFNAGDLLLSFRSINAIVVIDPDTLKIKWFNQGKVSRQHDPDWSNNGKFTIYDNRSHNYHSRIVQLDPDTHQVHPVVNNDDLPFYQFSEGMSDYIEPNSAIFTNTSELIHLSDNEHVEFAIVSQASDGKYRYLRTPRFFTADRHQQLLESCR